MCGRPRQLLLLLVVLLMLGPLVAASAVEPPPQPLGGTFRLAPYTADEAAFQFILSHTLAVDTAVEETALAAEADWMLQRLAGKNQTARRPRRAPYGTLAGTLRLRALCEDDEWYAVAATLSDLWHTCDNERAPVSDAGWCDAQWAALSAMRHAPFSFRHQKASGEVTHVAFAHTDGPGRDRRPGGSRAHELARSVADLLSLRVFARSTHCEDRSRCLRTHADASGDDVVLRSWRTAPAISGASSSASPTHSM